MAGFLQQKGRGKMRKDGEEDAERVGEYEQRGREGIANLAPDNQSRYFISTSHTAAIWQRLPASTKKWNTVCIYRRLRSV